MATRSIRKTLYTLLSRSYASLPLATPPSSTSSPSSFFLLRLNRRIPAAAAANLCYRTLPKTTARGFATEETPSSLNDRYSGWSGPPPNETVFLEGCDFEHHLVVMEKPQGNPSRDEIINRYIKTLATVVGSEEEARMKIYSISTRYYYAFGALVSQELSWKLADLPGVRWVVPDSYLDVRNKDYGGEPFINGQAVPYDPKYHEEWVKNNSRVDVTKWPGDEAPIPKRDRSNFERRREKFMNSLERTRENNLQNIRTMVTNNCEQSS